MPKGVLYVESRPSPQDAVAFHQWYDQTHLPEMLAVDGFVAARRFAPLGDDDPFVAIYEIEADDLRAAQASLTEATTAGKVSRPEGVRFDAPPVVRFYRDITAYAP